MKLINNQVNNQAVLSNTIVKLTYSTRRYHARRGYNSRRN